MSLHTAHAGLRTTRRLLAAVSSGRSSVEPDKRPTSSQPAHLPQRRRSISGGSHGLLHSPAPLSGPHGPRLVCFREHRECAAPDSSSVSPTRNKYNNLKQRRVPLGLGQEAGNDDHALSSPPSGWLGDVQLLSTGRSLSSESLANAGVGVRAPQTATPCTPHIKQGSRVEEGGKRDTAAASPSASAPTRAPEEGKTPTLLERISSILRIGAEVCSTGIAVELALAADDPKSQAKAIDRFRAGIATGNAALIFNLGLCHEQGLLGMQRDPKLARKCYKSAADLGNPNAQYNLGLMYYKKGKCQAACRLFRKAHRQGLDEASLAWAMCLMQGSPNDVAQSRKILSSLMRQGNKDAAKALVRASAIQRAQRSDGGECVAA